MRTFFTNHVRPFVDDYWKIFVAAAVALGLWLAAVAIDQQFWFWIAVVVPAVATALIRGTKWVLRARDTIRQYDGSLRLSANLKAEVELLSEELNNAKNEATSSYERGLREGRSDVLGVVLSTGKDVPEILGIAIVDGSVGLVGRSGTEVALKGARFRLRFTHSRALICVVEVYEVDPARGLTYMKAVSSESSRFWKGLERRIDSDQSPPPGVSLDRHSMNPEPVPTLTQLPEPPAPDEPEEVS